MNATSILEVGEFYGATDARWQTEQVTLTVLRHATPRAVPHHAHHHSYLTLLLEGGYREWAGDHELVYEPLSLVFHPERFEHRDEITVADSRFFTVEIHPALFNAHERLVLASVRDLTGGAAVWAMLRLLQLARDGQADFEQPVTEILNELLAPRVAGSSPAAWLVRVETQLQGDFRTPMSLAALAELAGVHPVHVERVFRAHHGCTIRTYVHRQRVVCASRMIVTGMPVATAALDAGFCDQSHMTRVFKAITGMSPVRFRDLLLVTLK